VSLSPGRRPALLAWCARTYPVTADGMVIPRSRWPALITTKAVITLVMLAIGRSVFRPRLQSSLPVAAFSTAADLAPTPDGPAEEAVLIVAVLIVAGLILAAACAAGAAAASAADAASAVPASRPHTRTLRRPLILMPLPLNSRR